MPGPSTQQKQDQSRSTQSPTNTSSTSNSPDTTLDFSQYDAQRSEIISNLQSRANYPEAVAKLAVEHLDKLLADPQHREAAKAVYEGVKNGDLKAFMEFFKEFDKRYQAELETQKNSLQDEVKEVKQELSEIQSSSTQDTEAQNSETGQATEAATEESQDAGTTQDIDTTQGTGEEKTNGSSTRENPQEQTSESTGKQASTDETSQSEDQRSGTKVETTDSPRVVIESSRVSFHQSAGGNTLRTINRDLRMLSDGSLQMRFQKRSGESIWLAAKDHTTGIECKALFCHEGSVYDAEGNRITQVKWGSQTHNIEHVANYAEQLSEGKLSGIRDGYLKDVTHNGKQVLFTKGLPPALQKAKAESQSANLKQNVERDDVQDTAQDAELDNTEQNNTAQDNTEQEDTVQDPEPENTAQDTKQSPDPTKEQTTEGNTELSPQNSSTEQTQSPSQEAEQSPKLPNRPQQQEKEIPKSRITFAHNTGYGCVQNIPRDLRLNTDGTLQMRFLDRNNESIWLEPNDRTTGIQCACLFHHNGKLYDAKGTEVKNLQWGSTTAQSSFILGYVDKLEAGKVSGIKSGYLNDVRHNGKKIVFSEGLPPGVEIQQEEVSERNVDLPQETISNQGTTSPCPTSTHTYLGQSNGYTNQYRQQSYQNSNTQQYRPNFRQRFRARFGRWSNR